MQRTVASLHVESVPVKEIFVERQNLTMRMGMRRFTRLTNAFSKKLANHEHSVALHFMHYNFCRWTLEEIIRLLD